MSANCFVARSTKVAARMLADELMIMSARDSSLYTLNESAAAIWNAADGRTSLAEIVESHICAEFDVDLDEALRDAETLVVELVKSGLLIVSNHPLEVDR